MLAETTLQYRAKWELTNSKHRFFKTLTCVGFSNSGRFVAFGGNDVLLLANADNGEVKAIVRNPGATLVALQWFSYENVTCAFSNGTIADITLSEVRTSNRTARLQYSLTISRFPQVSVSIEGLLVKQHSISAIAAERRGYMLASGAGSDIRVWTRSRQGAATASRHPTHTTLLIIQVFGSTFANSAFRRASRTTLRCPSSLLPYIGRTRLTPHSWLPTNLTEYSTLRFGLVARMS